MRSYTPHIAMVSGVMGELHSYQGPRRRYSRLLVSPSCNKSYKWVAFAVPYYWSTEHCTVYMTVRYASALPFGSLAAIRSQGGIYTASLVRDNLAVQPPLMAVDRLSLDRTLSCATDCYSYRNFMHNHAVRSIYCSICTVLSCGV